MGGGISAKARRSSLQVLKSQPEQNMTMKYVSGLAILGLLPVAIEKCR